jgi:CspA family cold shock protein
VPVGKVKWYDSDKGFGFLSKEEGGDVYVRAEALPAGVTNLKPALQVRLIDPPPSVAKAMRPKPEEMQVVIEDLIKMLDRIGENYRRGRQPDNKSAKQVATVLRGVADKLDV